MRRDEVPLDLDSPERAGCRATSCTEVNAIGIVATRSRTAMARQACPERPPWKCLGVTTGSNACAAPVVHRGILTVHAS
jgi:hypothetical protein